MPHKARQISAQRPRSRSSKTGSKRSTRRTPIAKSQRSSLQLFQQTCREPTMIVGGRCSNRLSLTGKRLHSDCSSSIGSQSTRSLALNRVRTIGCHSAITLSNIWRGERVHHPAHRRGLRRCSMRDKPARIKKM